jgi:putative acetyltransferase
MLIRAETTADVAPIHAVNVAAFPTNAEADLVERVRSSDAFIPELSLVAELDPDPEGRPGRIVGHLLLSRVAIAGLDEPILALAPMAVVPDHQRRGIGSALVRAGLDVAESRESRSSSSSGIPGSTRGSASSAPHATASSRPKHGPMPLSWPSR